jgi:hypothetical protein
MSGSTFTWVGGQDINGPNNWITPFNWTTSPGNPATRAPTNPLDAVIVSIDVNGSQDAIISGGQAITVASLTIGDPVGGVTATSKGGHVLVGGSSGVNGIGGGGGGSLNVTGPFLITSTNSGGAIVGGNNGVVTAPSLTVGGGANGLTVNPDVLIGGGGTFDIQNLINNGGILADGGFFDLGPLVLNSTTISGGGFLEVSGNSTLELNAATAQELRVLVGPQVTATVIFDQPTTFTGAINLLNPNSNVDLFFKNETPTGVTFDANAHTLNITFSDAPAKIIPFTSNGVVPLGVTASTRAGFGEVVLGPTPIPGTVRLSGTAAQYLIANNAGSLYVQDTVAGRDQTQILSGTTLMAFADGSRGFFDPTGTAEDVARVYLAGLGRGPDVAGLQFWTNQIDDSNVPLSAVANSFATSPEFIQTYGALQDPAFVQQLYLNVLGRAGDPGGEQFWDGVLASGGTRGTVLQNFAESPEFRTKTIATAGDKNDAEASRVYAAALGRAPDDGGKTFWSSQLESGRTPTEVAQGFVGSAEFQTRSGQLTPADFVNQLYQNVLHRAGDPAGQAFWTNVLQTGGSQAGVIVSFADSIENRAQTATATHDSWVFIPA